MKKIILVVMLLAITPFMNAEKPSVLKNQQFKTGEYRPLSINVGGVIIGRGYGPYLGMSYSIPLSGAFGIEPGLKLIYTSFTHSSSKDLQMDFHVPINFTYCFQWENIKWFILLGPMVDVGLFYYSDDYDKDHNVIRSYDLYDIDCNRVVVYANIGTRITYKRVGLELNYGIGLTNKFGNIIGDGGGYLGYLIYHKEYLSAGISYNF